MQFLQSKITLWFLLAMALLLLVGGIVAHSFHQLDTQKNWVEHTHRVIDEVEEFLSSIKDVVGSSRGYVITGQVEYLAPYNVALPKIDEDLKHLEKLIVDNPVQVASLNNLKERSEKRLAIAAEIIAAYQTDGAEKAFALVKTGLGKKEMDQIRIIAADMIGEEKRLLDVRQQQVDSTSALTQWLGAGGLILCIAILGAVFIFVARENRRRQQAEQTLQSAIAEIKIASVQDGLISQMADYLQGCKLVHEAYNIIGDAWSPLMPDMPGAVYIFKSSRNLLERAVDAGATASETDFAPDQCWALRRGQPHLVTADGNEPLCAHVKTRPVGGCLCLPMQAHGETLGCFFVSSDQPGAFTPARQRVIRRVAEQTSLAITNLKLQSTLRDQSIRDPLTGLFNRRYLEETTERELSRAQRSNQPLGIMVLDIDHFKKYNDIHGHDAGDAILVGFAQLIHDKVRKEDIACRYGGEEFVIVLPSVSLEGAAERARIICEATRQLSVKSGNETLGGITVSIGVAAFPGHGNRAENLISVADKALYDAKHGGRNQVKIARQDATTL